MATKVLTSKTKVKLPQNRKCRFCYSALSKPFLDLGKMPLANSYLTEADLAGEEKVYPLEVYLCDSCYLVQLADFERAEEIFNDQYAYFSSYSNAWLLHAKQYADKMIQELNLNHKSRVVEIASNDGYLLQFFLKQGIKPLGIEPCLNVAEAAIEKGIETVVNFLGEEVACSIVEKFGKADLLIANNVLAHVPLLNDFVSGLAVLLDAKGVLTIEFPSFQFLLNSCEFDTIYHEHFSYFHLGTVEQILKAQGLDIFDVERIPTHGGSLRIYACHQSVHPISKRVHQVKKEEEDAGLYQKSSYQNLAHCVNQIRNELLHFLSMVKHEGKTIAGYGAPAKGNTLLNYCGVKRDLFPFTVDKNPHKQNHYLPGSRIPILAVEEIDRFRPDYLFILPWNLKEEIKTQMSHIRAWNGQFVTAIPKISIE